jgi:WD40 repeat protein
LLDADLFSGKVQFTPDGKSVAYAIRKNGVDNVWMQPLDGSAGHAVTDFQSEQVWSMSFSPDGKRLAVKYQKWNLEAQQRFGTRTSVTVGYHGNHGIHELVQNSSANAFRIRPISTTCLGVQPTRRVFDAHFYADYDGVLGSFTVSVRANTRLTYLVRIHRDFTT